MRRTIVLTAVALGAIVMPAAAWEAPVRLSPPMAELDGPRLSTDDAGNALLVWSQGRRIPGQTSELPGESWVEAAYRPAGAGAWEPARRISPAGQPAYYPVSSPLPGGRALVAWAVLQVSGGTHESVRDPAGVWSADRPAGEPGVFAFEWAFGPDGTAAAAWGVGTSPDTVAMVAVRAPDGTWGPSTSLGPVAEGGQMQLAVGPGGVVTAVLSRPKGGAVELVARVRGTDGRWGDDIHLADGTASRGVTFTAQAVVTPAGHLVVAWGDIAQRRGASWRVHAVALADGRARRVTLGRQGMPPLHLVSAPGGARVVWQGVDGRARIAEWTGAGGWRAPVAAPASLICPGGNVAAAATGPLGEDVLVFTQNGIARAVLRRPDGAWTTPRIISAPGVGLGMPVTAAVAGARIEVAWARSVAGIRSVVETTSTTLAEADTTAVPQDIVPVITGLRVVRRAGRPPAAVFTLSRASRVAISTPVRPVPDFHGHRGRNVVPLRLMGGGPLPSGRVPITVTPFTGSVGGCQVTRVVELP